MLIPSSDSVKGLSFRCCEKDADIWKKIHARVHQFLFYSFTWLLFLGSLIIKLLPGIDSRWPLQHLFSWVLHRRIDYCFYSSNVLLQIAVEILPKAQSGFETDCDRKHVNAKEAVPKSLQVEGRKSCLYLSNV